MFEVMVQPSSLNHSCHSCSSIQKFPSSSHLFGCSVSNTQPLIRHSGRAGHKILPRNPSRNNIDNFICTGGRTRAVIAAPYCPLLFSLPGRCQDSCQKHMAGSNSLEVLLSFDTKLALFPPTKEIHRPKGSTSAFKS